MKIGYIGLGLMGEHIASHIAESGAETYVNDLRAEAMEKVAAHGAKAATKKELGENCDIVGMILPSAKIVKDVIFGEDGIAQYMKKGSLVIDQSSLSPEDSKECRDRLKEYGIRFMDAPVSGGPTGAASRQMAIMAGGSQADFDEANEAIFRHTGNSAILVGDVGAGNVCKLANQIIVNCNVAIVAEALSFAKKCGVDPAKVRSAIRSGAAGSWILDVKGQCMLDRTFEPGGSITVILKDIKNVMDAANASDAIVPYTAELYEILKDLRNHGYTDKDQSFICHYWEEMNGITIGEDK